MKKVENIKELQKIEYDLLQKFAEFCNKNNLRYYLAGGTLLGAIRHKGFIPWDDDIDLTMPRPDYMKLIEILKKEKISEEVSADSKYLDSKNPTTMLRIYNNKTKIIFKNYTTDLDIGAWIDIFPLDGLPNNKFKRKYHFLKHRILMDCFICSITKFGSKRRSKILTIAQYLLFPIYFIFKVIGHDFFYKLLEKNCLKYDFEKADLIGVVEGRAVEKETMNKNEFLKPIYCQFEKGVFSVPSCYDYYLTNLYGDYMKLPKLEDRVSRHEINIYWREEN